MKKTFANIRTLAALLIASAALAACSNEDGITTEQPAAEQAPKTYTLTLQAGKADGAQTRALKLETSGALTAYWEDGETVDVKKGGASVGTLTVSNAAGSTCTLSGTLTEPVEAGDGLFLYYNDDNYASQTGTLASAAAHDYAWIMVTVASVDGSGNITISEPSADFVTQSAMLKITMKDGSDNAINATSLTITVGSDDIYTFTGLGSAYTANGDGVLYFALKDTWDLDPGGDYLTATVTFTATVGTDTYTATKSGYPFAAGKYYATELTMAPAAPAARALAEATAGDLGKIAGDDGKIYDSQAAATAAGATAVAMIAYVGSGTGHATYTHGLAIALADESGEMKWSTAKSTCEGKTAVSGAAWLLPSQNQWKAMFKAFGGNEGKFSGLNTAITTAGGTALGSYKKYWSSTTYEDDEDDAYIVELDDSDASWENKYKPLDYLVRACLAF